MIFSFDGCEFDLDRYELRRAGHVAPAWQHLLAEINTFLDSAPAS